MASKLEIYRGTTYNFTYNHTDSTGAAVPLTGHTVYFTVKADKFDSSADDSTAIIKKTVTTHSNAAGGITTFTLTDTDTYKEPGKYYFSFLIEDNATLQTEPPSVVGTLTILPNQSNRQVSNG